jgi:hypothetical protein
MTLKIIVAALLSASLLSGCTAAKSLFGGNDNTVLPGHRENVLPPEQQTARDPVVTGDQVQSGVPGNQPCDPNVSDCNAPIDQEAGPTEGQ